MQHADPRILQFLQNSQNSTNNISVLGPTKSTTTQQKDIIIMKKSTKCHVNN